MGALLIIVSLGLGAATASAASPQLRDEQGGRPAPAHPPRDRGARPAPPRDVLQSQQAEAALAARAGANLDRFAAWLAAGRARGFIGEVGWPGNPEAAGDLRWNKVARAWYARAAAHRLAVAAWATGEGWAKTYKLAIYRATNQFTAVDVANPQAAVVEAQPAAELRGINVEGGAFGEYGAGYDPVAATSPLDNVNVGAYGSVYSYPSATTYSYLAGRGISFVRLAFRWERLQRSPGSTLDVLELARLRASVDAAARAGLRVVLDCHNYGAYYLHDGSIGRRRVIGASDLTVGHFADLWRRLAQAFADDSAILGYGLMNEPTEMRGVRGWETASQAAVRAIRAVGDTHRVYVAAYGWGSVTQFERKHRQGPWIDDPARNTWYEAHQYFDHNLSAHYRLSFDAEARAAGAEPASSA